MTASGSLPAGGNSSTHRLRWSIERSIRDPVTPGEVSHCCRLTTRPLGGEGDTNKRKRGSTVHQPGTIEYHLRGPFRELEVKSRMQLAAHNLLSATVL